MTNNIENRTYLTLFRRHLEEHREGLEHAPYSAHKGKLMAYKTIFLLLGLIFCVLGWYLWIAPFSWAFHALFNDNDQLRIVSCASCALLATCSFFMGVVHHPSDEIAIQIVKRAKKRLRKLYKRKRRQLSHGSARIALEEQLIPLNYRHEEQLEQIETLKEETLLILKRVRISRTFSEQEKERLFNEALYDIKEKIEEITQL